MQTDRKYVAQRILQLDDDQIGEVVIRIEVPIPDDTDYKCQYSIAWPDKTFHGHAMGVDSMQSLLLALHKIRADILNTPPAKAGSLYWLEAGDGCGLFGIPNC